MQNPTTSITATGDGTFGSGTDPVFNLGTVNNLDDDTNELLADNEEFAVVEFNAVVENIDR